MCLETYKSLAIVAQSIPNMRRPSMELSMYILIIKYIRNVFIV